MKKIILFPCYILIIFFFIILFTQQSALAEISLNDGKLLISGFVKEVGYYRTGMDDRTKKYNSNNLVFLQTSGLLEALYTVRDDDDMTIRLFAGAKYWWQKAQYFDDQARRKGIRQPDQRSWTTPRDFDDDILTEAYATIEKGPFEVRVGKQIVVWGSLNLAQITDVVNPPDFRRGYPGINTWEEIKQGSWMIRAFYQSELPGDLLFEVIFNPGDYKQIKLAQEGTWPGTSPYGVRRAGAGFGNTRPNGFKNADEAYRGIYSYVREKWTRDTPGQNTSNWEAGFRIRGYTYGIDWTVIYWNSLQDDFIITDFDENDKLYTNGWWIPSLNGEKPMDLSAFSKVFDSRRYEMIGGTFERYCPEIWDTVWIIEWALDFGHPIQQYGDAGPSGAIDWTRRNIFDIAIKFQKALNIPWFTQSFIATGRMLDFTISYQWDKVLGFKEGDDVSARWHGQKDSVADNITLWFKQDTFHNKIVWVFIGNYYPGIGRWQAIPSFGYSLPGVHWRLEGGYAFYGGKHDQYINYSSHNDAAFFRIRYEF
jgi:hypothetical protein